ncbi:MAG TPA: glycosyltransferase [Candidatus Limnocylindrales bacterium]|nr:glycosyltransferase [Candidatus Limnocylindrales bacterium]
MATGAAPDETRARVRPPRIAFLSYSSAEYDARTARMARTALRAGYEVVVYARDDPGLPDVERRDGYVVRRVPWAASSLVPGLGTLIRLLKPGPEPVPPPVAAPTRVHAAAAAAAPPRLQPTSRRRRIAQRLRSFPPGVVVTLLVMFPLRPVAWSRSLERVLEPADLYHGMWAGSLPALARHPARLGGRTVYDSRDVYLESRGFAHLPRPIRALLARLERRWARRVDRVLTVNEAYAGLLEAGLGVNRPVVVRNCPERWVPPEPPPDLIREALGLPATTAVVLYQGQLISDRGIEQAMEAILEVEGAVLVLMGFGGMRVALEAQIARVPWAGKAFLLPPVPPDVLLRWTASADVSVMPIAASSLNHRYTTPQKLFESLSAGVPVVASDLPGMAEVVRDADAGLLCDPQDPRSIAAAIRELLAASPAERQSRRRRILQVVSERYSWEVQEPVLLDLWASLLEGGPGGPTPAPGGQGLPVDSGA